MLALLRVGTAVGALVGAAVGALVGATVGALVRASVGALVGASVGAAVGTSVGASVGVSLGDCVVNKHWPGEVFKFNVAINGSWSENRYGIDPSNNVEFRPKSRL